MDYFFRLRSLYEINLINIKKKLLMVKFNLARVVKRKNESTCANKEDFNIVWKKEKTSHSTDGNNWL